MVARPSTPPSATCFVFGANPGRRVTAQDSKLYGFSRANFPADRKSNGIPYTGMFVSFNRLTRTKSIAKEDMSMLRIPLSVPLRPELVAHLVGICRVLRTHLFSVETQMKWPPFYATLTRDTSTIKRRHGYQECYAVGHHFGNGSRSRPSTVGFPSLPDLQQYKCQRQKNTSIFSSDFHGNMIEVEAPQKTLGVASVQRIQS